MNNLKFAFRQLVKNPGFTVVAVFTLALGIGATTAIFSVVNGVLLRPLPYKEPHRIVTVLHGGWNPVAPADYLDWRQQQTVFEQIAAAQYWGGTLTGRDKPEAIPGLSMGEGLLELLGIEPMLGRTFAADEFQPGKNQVLVLSHRLWQRRFGGETNIIGQTVTLDGKPYTKREGFYRTLLERIGSLPGVQSASAVNHLPLGGDMWTLSIGIEGRPPPLPGESIGAGFRVCRPGYFRTMGIPLLKGRDFTQRDTLDAPGVAIINETLARQQFPNEEPIGKRIAFDDPRNNPKWLTIVGVIKDVKQFDLKEPAINEVYWPFSQQPDYLQETAGHVAYMTIVVRTVTDPLNCVRPIEQILHNIDQNLPVSNVASSEQVMANAVWQPRFNLFLIGVFAAAGLVLAAVGIYGVISYSVSQRTHEIGIRMALGAARHEILKLVIHRGMLLAVLGVAIGLGGSLLLSRLIRTQLFGVPATDPLTFVSVSVLLLAVALLACLVPARRATKVDPMEALRYE